jgi:hypothetical protein
MTESKSPDPLAGLKPGRVVYYVDRDAERPYPAIVTFVHTDDGSGETPTRDGMINLDAMIDTGDTFERRWCQNVPYLEPGVEGEPGHESPVYMPGSWHWMFTGQNTRYQPDRVDKP